jgi:hypothetical protein
MKHRDYGPRAATNPRPSRAVVRPWAYQVRVVNPDVPPAMEVQIATDASDVVARVLASGATLPDDLVGAAQTGIWSVPLLTTLQMALQHETAGSQAVADDEMVQEFRKRLHLLLDHGSVW